MQSGGEDELPILLSSASEEGGNASCPGDLFRPGARVEVATKDGHRWTPGKIICQSAGQLTVALEASTLTTPLAYQPVFPCRDREQHLKSLSSVP